jgi:WD40 repeat protein
MKIWDTRNFRCLQTIQDFEQHRPENRVTAMAMDLDNQLVLTGTNRLHVWQSRAAQIKEHRAHTVALCGALYNSEFGQVVSCDENGTVCVWLAGTGELSFRFQAHHSGSNVNAKVTSMCFGPAGRRLVLGYHDGTLAIWNFNSGECLCRFVDSRAKNRLEVAAVAVCEDRRSSLSSRYVLSVGWARRLIVWPDDKDVVVQSPRRSAAVDDQEASEDTTGAKGIVPMRGGEPLTNLESSSDSDVSLGGSDIDDDELLSPGGQEESRLASWVAHAQPKGFRHPLKLTTASLATRTPGTTARPSGRTATMPSTQASVRAVGGVEAEAPETMRSTLVSPRTLSNEERRRLRRLEVDRLGVKTKSHGHHDDLTAVVVCGDGSVIATGGQDGIIVLWQLLSGLPRNSLTLPAARFAQQPARERAVSALAWADARAILFSAGADGWLRAWDIARGLLLLEWDAGQQRGENLTVLKLNAAATQLYTADSAGAFKIWDISRLTKTVVASLVEQALAVARAAGILLGQPLSSSPIKTQRIPAMRRQTSIDATEVPASLLPADLIKPLTYLKVRCFICIVYVFRTCLCAGCAYMLIYTDRAGEYDTRSES